MPPPLTPARFQHIRGMPKSPIYSSPVTSRAVQPNFGAPRHTVHLGWIRCGPWLLQSINKEHVNSCQLKNIIWLQH
jgi:hypothetical protein